MNDSAIIQVTVEMKYCVWQGTFIYDSSFKMCHGIFSFAVIWTKEFDVHVTMHRVKFLIIKPTRCTNFSNLFLEWNSTCSRQSSVHHQEFFTVHTATVYVIQVCWQLASRMRMELLMIETETVRNM